MHAEAGPSVSEPDLGPVARPDRHKHPSLKVTRSVWTSLDQRSGSRREYGRGSHVVDPEAR
jgi:hypothetical protein